jgi:hypothetical protein
MYCLILKRALGMLRPPVNAATLRVGPCALSNEKTVRLVATHSANQEPRSGFTSNGFVRTRAAAGAFVADRASLLAVRRARRYANDARKHAQFNSVFLAFSHLSNPSARFPAAHAVYTKTMSRSNDTQIARLTLSDAISIHWISALRLKRIKINYDKRKE